MCTVTIVGLDDGFRLACNRDELRTRPEAQPPEVRQFGRYSALTPIDPVSGGTWIAATEAGWTATLLNVNLNVAAKKSTGRPHKSRGAIIPALLHTVDIDEALGAASLFDPSSFPPFRLVVADDTSIGEVFSDGSQLRLELTNWNRSPRLFTSSGLGDQLVEPPRRALFQEMFQEPGDLLEAQDAYHRHSWPDRPHLSVCMSRAEARTVSHTVVEIRVRTIEMAYSGKFDDPTVAPEVRNLRRRLTIE